MDTLLEVFRKDSYTIPEEVYGRPIYITDEERDMIYNAKLDDDRLIWVRDIFVFQCHVGLRGGELFNFRKSNINNCSLT